VLVTNLRLSSKIRSYLIHDPKFVGMIEKSRLKCLNSLMEVEYWVETGRMRSPDSSVLECVVSVGYSQFRYGAESRRLPSAFAPLIVAGVNRHCC
jgi:hypothetical protein